MIVDTHCHLDYLDKDLETVKQEAKDLGVEHFVTIGVEEAHWDKLMALADDPQIDVALGVHPCDVQKANAGWEERLLSLAKQEKVVAIGETGLDYYHDTSFIALQKEAFLSQIDIAKQLGKPIVVHMRDAKQDVIPMIQNSGVRGIMHCFSEDYETAKKAIDAGFLISFSGVITFKNAVMLQEVVKKVPLSSILVETDAPFLTPVPYRGKKNYPGYVHYVAKQVASLKNISLEEVSRVTTENYFTLIR